uniref:ATP synthase F0 subunit 8 n=1 Tax=Paracarsidara gigantea TaxID=2218136 RepID=A0A344A2L1_9HEMI|nr:ATP synthase F0 subunit 8 [Paracarsidara gigantea]AWU49002.1 ATP synthase F0 subunit 8 [Paracarsidara gigantea]
MPQMAPMSWLLILIMIFMILIMLKSWMYFLYKSKENKKSYFNMKNLPIKW